MWYSSVLNTLKDFAPVASTWLIQICQFSKKEKKGKYGGGILGGCGGGGGGGDLT